MRLPSLRGWIMGALLCCGALAMIGGGLESGTIITLIAVAFWGVTDWFARRRRFRRAKPIAVAVVDHRTRSDGADGAFSRLDPATQAWILAEIRARKDSATSG